jgi:hypothetical protein
MQGTVSFQATPTAGRGLAVLPILSSALLAGGGTMPTIDPSTTQFAPTSTDLVYPYSITGIAPGTYVPFCAYTDGSAQARGQFSAPLNILLVLMPQATINAGATATADFTYGPGSLAGVVTVNISTALPEGATPKVLVAGKTGVTKKQLVLIPATMTRAGGSTTQYTGTFTEEALGNVNFKFKVFATADGSDPTAAAFTWLMTGNPKDDPTVTSVDVNGATQVTLTPVTVP